MPRRKQLPAMSEFATKTDVEGIVTRVVSSIVTDLVTTLVPPIVGKIVDQKLDEKLDKKLDERFESFAIMVANGFADTQAQINDIRQEMVTKTEFNEFTSEMIQFRGEAERSFFYLRSDVADLKDRMGKVEIRIETFEGSVKTILRDHEVRIVDLEGSSA